MMTREGAAFASRPVVSAFEMYRRDVDVEGIVYMAVSSPKTGTKRESPTLLLLEASDLQLLYISASLGEFRDTDIRSRRVYFLRQHKQFILDVHLCRGIACPWK